MNINDCTPGLRVRYVPFHARGNANHPDCENGIVSSHNDVNVFVRYQNKHGEYATSVQSTSPEDLIPLLKVPK